MIDVTRLDGSGLMVNADLIERIERTPDTLVALANGETFLVREQPDELVARIVAYKRAILGPDRPAARADRHAGGER